MDDTRWIARYSAVGLLVVGGLEWLLGRTVSRMAASPALEGTPRDIIVTLGKVGLFLVTPSLLLAICLLAAGLWLLARRASVAQDRGLLALVSYLTIAGAVNLAYTLLPPADWLTICFNLIMWAAVWWIALRFAFDGAALMFVRLGVVLAALAYSGWYLYVLGQQILPSGTASDNAGIWAVSLGELFAVLTPMAFFAAVALPGGEWKHPKRWIAPVLVALFFAGGNISDAIANQGFTGVFTTWSLGINVTWPWPIYVFSLALYLYAVITCFKSKGSEGYANPNTGAGLMLLLLGGYNLQISYQHLLAILALMLLTGRIAPLSQIYSQRWAGKQQMARIGATPARSEEPTKPNW